MRTLLLGCLTFIVRVSGSGQCYYPDGTIPTDYEYVPCTGSQYSSCCIPSEGDVCMSNGLCYFQDGQYLFRGACSDQTWKDNSCPKFCNQIDPDTWTILTSCGGTKYCCSSSSSECCSKQNLVFDIGVPSVIQNYNSPQTVGNTLGSAPTTWQHSVITATTGSGLVITTGKSSSAPTGLISSQTESAQPNASHSHLGLIIGVVAGVVVILLLITVVSILFCVVRRRNQKGIVTQTVNLKDIQDQQQRPPGTSHSSAPQKYEEVGATYYTTAAPPAYAPPQSEVKPYQVTPVGHYGESLIELQSPVARPTGADGRPLHELS